MSSDVRLGIIGAGANTMAKHIPLLQAIDGVEIIGVVNRSRESSINAVSYTHLTLPTNSLV